MKDIVYWGPILLLVIITSAFVIYPAYDKYMTELELQKVKSNSKKANIAPELKI
ncbi:MAG: hypothetical protein KAQ67_05195 [Gammaproteobacteria bacterium]|nr:hypothetical protein [Gammaproteobacteria bacterium]